MASLEIDNAIAVMQAYKEGKTIQCINILNRGAGWEDCTGAAVWDFFHYEYRIKPEPHYRPFKSAEEVMSAIKEHGMILRHKSCHICHFLVIFEWNDFKVWTGIYAGKNYEDVFEKYTFVDGTPFGKED